MRVRYDAPWYLICFALVVMAYFGSHVYLFAQRKGAALAAMEEVRAQRQAVELFTDKSACLPDIDREDRLPPTCGGRGWVGVGPQAPESETR